MEITKVEDQGETVFINGTTSIPKDEDLPLYQDVLAWEKNGGVMDPPADTTESDIVAAKWVTYTEYCNALTVTVLSGNKFAANPGALNNVAFKRDAISDTAEPLWVEEWATFNTNKVELQEVISEAEALTQAKIVELFGV